MLSLLTMVVPHAASAQSDIEPIRLVLSQSEHAFSLEQNGRSFEVFQNVKGRKPAVGYVCEFAENRSANRPRFAGSAKCKKLVSTGSEGLPNHRTTSIWESNGDIQFVLQSSVAGPTVTTRFCANTVTLTNNDFSLRGFCKDSI